MQCSGEVAAERGMGVGLAPSPLWHCEGGWVGLLVLGGGQQVTWSYLTKNFEHVEQLHQGTRNQDTSQQYVHQNIGGPD